MLSMTILVNELKDNLLNIIKLKSLWLLIFWIVFLIWSIVGKEDFLVKFSVLWIIVFSFFFVKDVVKLLRTN